MPPPPPLFPTHSQEFATRFHRLLGKNAMFPFGFHCTGMPIQVRDNTCTSHTYTAMPHPQVRSNTCTSTQSAV